MRLRVRKLVEARQGWIGTLVVVSHAITPLCWDLCMGSSREIVNYTLAPPYPQALCDSGEASSKFLIKYKVGAFSFCEGGVVCRKLYIHPLHLPQLKPPPRAPRMPGHAHLG